MGEWLNGYRLRTGKKVHDVRPVSERAWKPWKSRCGRRTEDVVYAGTDTDCKTCLRFRKLEEDGP